MYTAVFEQLNGKQFSLTLDSVNLEDATIEATTIAEERCCELLAVDYEELIID